MKKQCVQHLTIKTEQLKNGAQELKEEEQKTRMKKPIFFYISITFGDLEQQIRGLGAQWEELG